MIDLVGTLRFAHPTPTLLSGEGESIKKDDFCHPFFEY